MAKQGLQILKTYNMWIGHIFLLYILYTCLGRVPMYTVYLYPTYVVYIMLICIITV